ncbi:reverse transcriptase domain-containing protein [Tanacetum coccineum]
MMQVATSFLQGQEAASNQERKKISSTVWKHQRNGHNTDECNHLRKQIEDMLKAGKLSHIIWELKQSSRKDQPKKKGETSGKEKPQVNAAMSTGTIWNNPSQQPNTNKGKVSNQQNTPGADSDDTFPTYGENQSWDHEGSSLSRLALQPVKGKMQSDHQVGEYKIDAVLSRQSPKYLKDMQKLNGKLASLNRFLAKSAKKSLPFLKTLKKCTKKSDFLWTEEVEAAFRQMKEHIAKLPMLTVLEEQEELIVYLAASKEAVSAILMMERKGLAAATVGKTCMFRISQVTYRRACLMLALEGFPSSLFVTMGALPFSMISHRV